MLFRTFTRSLLQKTNRSKICRVLSVSYARYNSDKNTFSTLSSCLHPDIIDEFQENGAVCLRNVFDKHWQEVAHKGIEKCFNNPSEYCDWIIGEDGEGVYFNDYMNWEKVDEIKEYAFNSQAAAIAGQLMKSNVSIFFHDHVFVKKGGKNRAAPWHHDQAYYPIDGMQNCTIWMPTTPVNKETCLRFVKGSHLWQKWFHPKKFVSHLNYSLDTIDNFEYEDIPEDIDDGTYEILTWDLQPGDCIAFHMKTLHATTKASATSPRYVIATRWLGDDAVYARRPWKSSPPQETLPKGLQLGANISTTKSFPIIWQKMMNTE